MKAFHGKLPPHDLDAEASVLSAAMLSDSARDDALAILEGGHFYSDANRLIWCAIQALAAKGEPVDAVTVASHLRTHGDIKEAGGPAYIAQVVDCTPAVANVADHARIVWRKAKRRETLQALHELVAAGYELSSDDDAYLESVDARITSVLAHDVTKQGPTDMREALLEFQAEVRRLEAGEPAPKIPTPLASLTEQLGGGWGPGELWIVAGRPGHGKSTLANQSFRKAAEHGWVANFSVEMPTIQVVRRMLAGEARVELGKVKSATMTREEWGRVATATERLAAMPIVHHDHPVSPLMVASQSRAVARRAAKAGSKLAMVVVDYLQIMTLAEGNSREEQIAHATRSMKILARELECTVLLLSQLNRATQGRPRMNDLKGSGAIEADADGIVFTYRQSVDELKAGQAPDPYAELVVAKQRDGSPGVVACQYDGPRLTFKDGEPETDQWASYQSMAREMGL